MAEFGFTKDSRLIAGDDYKAVFETARYKVSCRHFLMLASNSKNARGRLGMVIAKKTIAKAVQRNRIKRLVRESFRKTAKQLPVIDVVVLARRDADKLNNAMLLNKINTLWKDLQSKIIAQLATID